MKYKYMNKKEREVSSLSFGEMVGLSQKDIEWIKASSDMYFPEQRRQYTENGRYRGVLLAYFVFYQRVGNWQVIRFIAAKDRPNYRSYFEPIRYWLDKDGNSVLECKLRQCMGTIYCDHWCEDSPLEIRRTANKALFNLDWTQNYHRVKSLIPELARMHFRMPYGSPYYYTKELLTDGHLEMLHRMGLKYLCHKYYLDNNREDMWTAIRIALRHHYPLKSERKVNLWWDMVKMELRCGADVNSPHYVAPDDLTAMHDRFVRHENNLLRRQQREALIANENARYNRIKKDEVKYKEDKKQFLDIVFSDDRFSVHVLQSIKEFKDEGIAMEHCVFACGYYDKKDSVIVSIRDKRGRRVETAEIDTKRFFIRQQYGRKDIFSEWHEDIKKLLNDNMWRFRQATMKKAV